MSKLITAGLGFGPSTLITWGLGYVTVVVPPPIEEGARGRPRRIRLWRAYEVPLERLGIIRKYIEGFDLKTLDLMRLTDISIRLNKLGIPVPAEVSGILQQLSILSKTKTTITNEELRIIQSHTHIYLLDKTSLIAALRKFVKLAIKIKRINLNIREMKKHLEILDLLDELDRMEET